MPTALTTLRNVELAHVGTFMPNSTTGEPWVVRPEDIAAAVEASKNPSFRKPVCKLGHKDPRFTKGDHAIFMRDGNPGVGVIVNQRASDDGQRLIADIEGMPTWLAEIVPYAYPSRSVDAMLHASDGKGNSYSLVITHLALLGETVPAIESLADVAALYGHTDTDVTEWTAASHVAATFQGEPMAETVSAARVDAVMAAAEAAAGEGRWCREILRDKVVYVNAQGMVWTAPWSEVDGAVAIGAPVPVAVQYQPLAASPAAIAAHAMNLPVSYLRLGGDTVSAGSDVRTITTSHGVTSMSIAPAVREALGMSETDTEEAVNAALLERLNTPAVAPTTIPEPAAVTPPAPVIEPVPVAPVVAEPIAASDHRSDRNTTRSDRNDDIEQRVAAAVAAALPTAVSAHMAPLAASNETLRTELSRVTTELAAAKQTEADKVRENVITAAISAGKIRSADRERYLKLYDKAPEDTTELLGSIAAGAAVPISAAGYAGDADQTTDEFKSFAGAFGWGDTK
jgi:hypothetical protein